MGELCTVSGLVIQGLFEYVSVRRTMYPRGAASLLVFDGMSYSTANHALTIGAVTISDTDSVAMRYKIDSGGSISVTEDTSMTFNGKVTLYYEVHHQPVP